jgi:hypothetical protein
VQFAVQLLFTLYMQIISFYVLDAEYLNKSKENKEKNDKEVLPSLGSASIV